ncbi:transcription factor BHLH148 [Dendrobium catenatum]|uniref:transcription factor BHLH148 n=1 Tax=Dendrobium catenatum TaxID=906689 RepID=UPI00109FF0A2|nr:transcription factor BHLH148 [Dendrobium catenatum]
MDPFFFPDQDELQDFWGLSVDPTVDLLDAVTQHLSRPASSMARRSAFSKYTGPIAAPPQAQGSGGGGGGNIHRRIIELLRRIRRGKQESKGGGGGGSSSGGEGSRGFRHMMRERQRRERLSQSYADLYAILSPSTKADKNSIVQTAAALVRELKGVKEGLQKRNEELMRMAAPAEEMAEGTSSERTEQRIEVEGDRVITVRAENSASAIDSVIGALRCLERMDVKARAIRFAAAAGGGMTGGVMMIETNKGSTQ